MTAPQSPEVVPVFPSMEGCDGKLRRAEQHYKIFRKEVTDFARGDTHNITVEDNPDTSQYVFKVFGLKPTDPDWGLIAGDCFHNLRSALDHLVYQLAILGRGGRDLSDSEARGIGFPIFDSPEDFAKKGRGNIVLLRPGEQTRITELQPFHGWDASVWGLSHPSVRFGRMGPAVVPGLLQELRDLDNTDKHRTVHATWRATDPMFIPRPPFPSTGSSGTTLPLEDSTEIGRWNYTAPRPDLPADMDVKAYFPLVVSLGEPPKFYSAVEMLGWLVAMVSDILNLFRPCIDTGEAPAPVTTLPRTYDTVFGQE